MFDNYGFSNQMNIDHENDSRLASIKILAKAGI